MTLYIHHIFYFEIFITYMYNKFNYNKNLWKKIYSNNFIGTTNLHTAKFLPPRSNQSSPLCQRVLWSRTIIYIVDVEVRVKHKISRFFGLNDDYIKFRNVARICAVEKPCDDPWLLYINLVTERNKRTKAVHPDKFANGKRSDLLLFDSLFFSYCFHKRVINELRH